MRKKISFLLMRCFIIALAVAIVIPLAGIDDSYAAKKTKKVGKIYGADSFVENGINYETNKSDAYLWWYRASGAKKYQIYKANSVKGKYHRIKTVRHKKNNNNNLEIKTPKGLECYKIRGIRGKKKGKFTPVIVAYGYTSTVESAKVLTGGITLVKVKIDNTAANSRDMVFYNPKGTGISYVASKFGDSDKTYDEEDGFYSDSKGNYVKKWTIKAGTTSYLYIVLYGSQVKTYYDKSLKRNGNTETVVEQVFYIVDGKYKKYYNCDNFIRTAQGKTYNVLEYTVGNLD